MAEIAIVRAAHLHVYVDELREIGVPVEQSLSRSRLPPWALEDPDAYISLARCLEWLATCSKDVELMEFGFRAARRGSLASLSASFQRAILGGPTGLARFQAFIRYSALEDNVLSIQMQSEGEWIRLSSTISGFEKNPLIALAEWVDLQGMISVIRSVAGPLWCPPEMTFVSRQRPTNMVQEAFPNTRILVGQPRTSFLVGRDLLEGSCRSHDGGPANRETVRTNASADGPLTEWNFAEAIRAAVRPYLADGYPALREMAETFQMSERTFQRRIQQCGRNYSDLVQEARFDLACEMLIDPSIKIVDVAFAAGYENQQHFSRAFRRHACVSPTVFRRSLAKTE
jgi:AraC-like DNA-binding protein